MLQLGNSAWDVLPSPLIRAACEIQVDKKVNGVYLCVSQRCSWFLPDEEQEVEKNLAWSRKQILVPLFLPAAIQQQSWQF